MPDHVMPEPPVGLKWDVYQADSKEHGLVIRVVLKNEHFLSDTPRVQADLYPTNDADANAGNIVRLATDLLDEYKKRRELEEAAKVPVADIEGVSLRYAGFHVV